ncbi:MAG TPA: GNAT family N-acetyltransferase [Devosia sp.]|nr:GNAT family N-acetyltransferase [Devosia sp.]
MNRASALALRPKPDQQQFVATNERSLQQAVQSPSCIPFLILAGTQPVGFAMYALDPDDGNYWIYRLMIDGDFQGRGYGTRALAAMTDMMFETTGCPFITLGVAPENVTAIKLYERAGFRDAGFEIDGEMIMRLQRSEAHH